MTKQQKKYMKIGQTVCETGRAIYEIGKMILILSLPIIGCNIAELLCMLIIK